MSTKTTRLLGYFEKDLELRLGKRTVPNYLHDVAEFLEWLSGRGLELTEVRPQDVETYQNALLALRKKDGKAYSIGNQHNRLSAIKSLFRFLYQRGYVLSDPTTRLNYHLKESRLPRTILTEKEVRKLIDAASNPSPRGLRDRAVFELLYATGLRATELANLTPWDVNLEERTLRIDQGKGRKDRNVPLTRAACEAMEVYLSSAGRSFFIRSRRRFSLLRTRAGGFTGPFSRGSSLATPKRLASGRGLRRTPSAIRWRPIFSRAGPTSGTSRCSWATTRFEPPSATPTSRSRT